MGVPSAGGAALTLAAFLPLPGPSGFRFPVSGFPAAASPPSGSSGWSLFLEGFFLAIYEKKEGITTEYTEYTEGILQRKRGQKGCYFLCVLCVPWFKSTFQRGKFGEGGQCLFTDGKTART